MNLFALRGRRKEGDLRKGQKLTGFAEISSAKIQGVRRYTTEKTSQSVGGAVRPGSDTFAKVRKGPPRGRRKMRVRRQGVQGVFDAQTGFQTKGKYEKQKRRKRFHKGVQERESQTSTTPTYVRTKSG